MCESTIDTGHRDQKRGGTHLCAFGRSAPDLLALPRLDASIPKTAENDSCGHQWAQIALLWLDAGELTDDDSGHPRELTETAVMRWITKQLEGVSHLGRIELAVNPNLDFYGYSNEEERDLQASWLFGVYPEDVGWYQLEAKIRELEQAHPGLGQTALAVFEAKHARLLPVFTPEMARQRAEYVWWYGMNSQEDYEDEVRNYHGEEVDEAVLNAEGPAAFDACFPDWMFSRSDTRLTLETEKLQDIATSGKTAQARAVASLLVELMQIASNSYRLPWVMGDSPIQEENVYFSAYIRWNGTDILWQLDDDIVQHANGAGDCYTDMLGADAVPFDPNGFFKWKTEMEAGFAVLRKLDALLPLISDPIERE